MKTIEQQVEEFVQMFLKHTKDRTRAYLDNHNNQTGYKWFCSEVAKALQERDRIAREEERDRLIKIVRKMPGYNFHHDNPFANVAQGQSTTVYSNGYDAGKAAAVAALTTPLDKE